MNLNEQVNRIKKLMNLISEQDDPVFLFWNDTTKTDDQKLQEIKKVIDPIINQAKEYFYNYISGSWFKSKITEKINSSNKELNDKKIELENLKKQLENQGPTPDTERDLNSLEIKITILKDEIQYIEKKDESKMKNYDQKEIDDLKTYIKNIIVKMTVDDPHCNGVLAFYRDPDVYFCAKQFEPKMKNKIMMVSIHEIKHAIVDYIEEKRMVPIIPDDIKINIDIMVNPAIQGHSQEGIERIALVQNLRRIFGVDDFISVDNLKKLFKKNIDVYSDKKLKIKYSDDNIMRIYTNKNYEKDNLLLLKVENQYSVFGLFIKNQESEELKEILLPFSKTVNINGKDVIEIDLNEVFKNLQSLAKTNNQIDINYT